MDEAELETMLEYALGQTRSPVAIRYPRGGSGLAHRASCPPVEPGRSQTLVEGRDGCVLAIGSMVGPALAAAQGMNLTVINARSAKPIDLDGVRRIAATHGLVVTVEENVLAGGYGALVEQALEQAGYRGRLLRIGLPDSFVEQAPRHRLLELVGLDRAALAERFRAFFR
jgi:1-deoxy-D-xylulose-5-phosphate synthase